MKKVNRYQVRYYPTPTSYSQYVGKGKLHKYRTALKIVKRLKKAGIDAFADKWIINECSLNNPLV